MQDCMEHCSRYWGKGEGCFGVVWVEAKNDCWIRNSTTSTKNLHSDPGFYAALLTQGEMQGYDTTCPNTDLSVNTLPGVPGMQYTTHCGKVINGYDACFSGDPSCFQAPYQGYFHATSLQECLKICVDAHPLCQGVSYNPGLQIGYANCWLKTGFPSTLSDPDSTMGTMHSATITQIDSVDRTCPSTKTYKAQGGSKQNFDIHCGQLNTGSNITSVHMQNITSCIDTCASSDKKCVSVVFDSAMQAGFNNCYLQNTTSVISDQASATYAVLSGSNAPSASNGASGSGLPSPQSSNAKSSSKAWIAGPVLGGLLALALIGLGIFFLRRRKAARGAQGQKYELNGASAQHGGAEAPPYYQPEQHQHNASPATEMDTRWTSELPAGKYAKMQQPVQHPMHELPS